MSVQYISLLLTETCTYTGETSTTNAFDGYRGLRISQRYTGVVREGGTILVALVVRR